MANQTESPPHTPNIGVFLCKCGKNIAGTIDIDELAKEIEKLPEVKLVHVNTYTCSDPGQAEIETAIKEQGIEKIVVAACSPRLHGPTWKTLLRRVGVNPSLVEVANIREQCSWVHLSEKEEATIKAKELIEMAIAKAELLQAIDDIVVPVKQRVLIIGGGVAGIQAALDLADNYEVVLVEKSPTIGGKMALIDKTFPTMDCSICILGPKMADVGNHENITLISNAEVTKISGYVGNFEVEVTKQPRYVKEEVCTACGECVEICPENVIDEYSGNLGWRKAIYIPYPQAVPASYIIDEKTCTGLSPLACGKCIKECDKEAIIYEDSEKIYNYKIGAIIISVGFELFDASKITEYGWGHYPNVITTFEFERLINAAGPTNGELVRPSDLKKPKKIAFINCVGSRDVRFNPYCSNFCCMESIKNSLLIKEHWPEVEVVIFYIDIRAFGKGFEELYLRSRKASVLYIRGHPGQIREDPNTKNLILSVENINVGNILTEEFDLVVLSIGAEGSSETIPFPVAKDPKGFYIEAHPKLRPVDTPNDGIFIAGGAESPKDIRETVTQASAAAGRCSRLISKGEFHVEPLYAFVDVENCNSCGICVSRCPYNAVSVDREKKTPAHIIPILCKGCGTCAADCPTDAITMTNFTDAMILRQIDIALRENAAEKVLIFACNWCSYAGADLSGTSRIQYEPNTRIVRTMCSGRVDIDFIKHCFERGAGAVILSGCHPQDCHYISGNDFAVKREKRIRSWMKKNKIESERFSIEFISAAEGKKFADIVSKVSKIVKK
ncbi:MAG: CoB--CoM heterodisulfide reductase iron-sulfur subunit A [Candidatus Lokiarchaeum sp. GC14_75]|nr:MAG: CoB--CoM heterodisulfide reductase iron-sulfur subunit A [Candidatus Lokiarchaeum sp. GC14_75]